MKCLCFTVVGTAAFFGLVTGDWWSALLGGAGSFVVIGVFYGAAILNSQDIP